LGANSRDHKFTGQGGSLKMSKGALLDYENYKDGKYLQYGWKYSNQWSSDGIWWGDLNHSFMALEIGSYEWEKTPGSKKSQTTSKFKMSTLNLCKHHIFKK